MTGVAALADFSAGLTFESLSVEVQAAAVLHFLDALGVGLAASRAPHARAWDAAATAAGGAPRFWDAPERVPIRRGLLL